MLEMFRNHLNNALNAQVDNYTSMYTRIRTS